MRPLKTLFIIVACVGLSACTLFPQNVHLNPHINVAHSAIGRHRAVALHVVDERSDTNLGVRAYGPASGTMKLASKIDDVVRSRVVEMLHAKSFKPKSSLVRTRRRLLVKMLSLHMYRSSSFFTVSRRSQAAIEAIATNGSHRYTQVYHGVTSKTGMMLSVTAHSNTQHLNDVMAAALNQMANDTSLWRFLAR